MQSLIFPTAHVYACPNGATPPVDPEFRFYQFSPGKFYRPGAYSTFPKSFSGCSATYPGAEFAKPDSIQAVRAMKLLKGTLLRYFENISKSHSSQAAPSI